MRTAGPLLLCLILVLAACSGGAAGSVPDTGRSAEAVDVQETTTTQPCEQQVRPLTLTEAPETTPEGLIALSAAVYSCMPAAVVVQGADITAVQFAAETAMNLSIPLLGINAAADRTLVAEELDRLGVTEVIAIGLDPALGDGLAESVRAEPIPPAVAPETTVESTSTSGNVGSSASTSSSIGEANENPEGPSTTTLAEDVSSGPSTVAAALVTTTAPPRFEPPVTSEPASEEGPVVLYGEGEVRDAYLSLPAVTAGGGQVAVVDFNNVDAVRELLAGRTSVFVGGESPTPTEEWQLALAASDTELFGGGTKVFPDRRIIAYYGNPLTFRLGILGETDPDRAVERVTERAVLYDAEGLPPAQPGFEIIVTVASNRAGEDGNYSNEMELETIRPWIDAARERGVSVILDLQPGRTDFVTQAKLYEEFLRLPNVGLALDPEWRLEPDQRHLRQIGSVGAEEINAVIDYLVSLVHEETLPQKVLILHQFQRRMLPDRELVKTPPELAVVVHVDGQGSLGSKYGTWAAMLDAPTLPEQQLWWGWKNFIDEDFPTATPGQVNAVEPLPMVVTYQ